MDIRRRKTKGPKGFSLIEVLIGIALIGVAILGLAQLFLLGVWNNRRADLISNGTYLAQQEIDHLRTLTNPELDSLPAVQDEQIDVNSDGIYDCRRITQIDHNLKFYMVYVFPPSQLDTAQSDLLASPGTHQAVAQMGAIIDR